MDIRFPPIAQGRCLSFKHFPTPTQCMIYRNWELVEPESASCAEIVWELLRLLQLAITYWQQTMPKTSRKQAVLLKDLLQPNLIDGQYALLLQKII